jgi:CO/xanthine dehydrogenase FAD-binding subunit
VWFPFPQRAGYAKLLNFAKWFALIGAFVAETPTALRVAATAAGLAPFRLLAAEAALAPRITLAALDEAERRGFNPPYSCGH